MANPGDVLLIRTMDGAILMSLAQSDVELTTWMDLEKKVLKVKWDDKADEYEVDLRLQNGDLALGSLRDHVAAPSSDKEKRSLEVTAVFHPRRVETEDAEAVAKALKEGLSLKEPLEQLKACRNFRQELRFTEDGCSDGGFRNEICSHAGLARLLVEICRDSPHVAIQQTAIDIILDLGDDCNNNNSMEPFLENGFEDVIYKQLLTSGDWYVKEAAFRCMPAITKADDYEWAADDVQMLLAKIDLAESSASLMKMAQALSNLVRSDIQHAPSMVSAALRFIGHTEIRVCKEGVDLIQNMVESSDEKMLTALIRDLIPKLIQLLSIDDRFLKQDVLNIFARISQNNRICQVVLSKGILDSIKETSAASKDFFIGSEVPFLKTVVGSGNRAWIGEVLAKLIPNLRSTLQLERYSNGVRITAAAFSLASIFEFGTWQQIQQVLDAGCFVPFIKLIEDGEEGLYDEPVVHGLLHLLQTSHDSGAAHADELDLFSKSVPSLDVPALLQQVIARNGKASHFAFAALTFFEEHWAAKRPKLA
eukprot:TRINITY_DN19365_c0_g2_i1.p1 TRINITY_DN19365_c0_g2~~TRINITY_DN19365_c0_g2_i1.p1  ORF type:complete len:535 (+),score=92.29 TRINITY_DN19365_c0_g2_i1:92-1696(+)